MEDNEYWKQILKDNRKARKQEIKLEEVLKHAKLQGGGGTYFEMCGRYCFCPAYSVGEIHSIGCDNLNKALKEAIKGKEG